MMDFNNYIGEFSKTMDSKLQDAYKMGQMHSLDITIDEVKQLESLMREYYTRIRPSQNLSTLEKLGLEISRRGLLLTEKLLEGLANEGIEE